MKTSINLSEYDFKGRRLMRQIPDDPETGFARVIVSQRTNILDDIEQIELKALTYYINSATGRIVPQMTHETLSKGKRWIISNDYKVILVDGTGTPLANPNFDAELPQSEDNFPYKRMPAYDRFAEFLFSETNPVSLPFIWKLNVSLDAAKGYFDFKESYD